MTLHLKRTLKRLDLTAKTLFALIEEGSCFVGSLFEAAAAADRQYMFEEDDVTIGLTELNFGALPMSNGLTRLQTRFLGEPAHPDALRDGSARPSERTRPWISAW